MLHFLSEVVECFFPLSQSKALGYRQYLVCVGSKINHVWITITSLEVWLWGSLLWGSFFVYNSGTQTATCTMRGTEQLLDNDVLLLLKAYGSSFFYFFNMSPNFFSHCTDTPPRLLPIPGLNPMPFYRVRSHKILLEWMFKHHTVFFFMKHLIQSG